MAEQDATTSGSTEEVTLKDLFDAARGIEHLTADPVSNVPELWTGEGAENLKAAIDLLIGLVTGFPRKKRTLLERLAHAEGESARGACERFERYWKRKDRTKEGDLVELAELDVAVSRLIAMTVEADGSDQIE